MEYPAPSNNSFPHEHWQILGELNLSVGSNAYDALSRWLMEVLSPLSLHADFLNQVLKSARGVAARDIQFESTALEFKHIHFLVFAPENRSLKGQTWGFFRIEKVGTSSKARNPSDHSIEFYLYFERQ